MLSVRDKSYGIKVIASKDEGESWEELGRIYTNEVSGDIGYPCSVQLKAGNVLTVFYAHESEGAPAEIMQVVWKFNE